MSLETVKSDFSQYKTDHRDDLNFSKQTHGENFEAEFAPMANELNAL